MATITLGAIVDAASEPTTRAAIYEETKCPTEPCHSCSMVFRHTWAFALKAGLIVRVGWKFALRGWDV